LLPLALSHFEVVWHKVYLISSKLYKLFSKVVGLLKKLHLLNTWLSLAAVARGAVQDHLLTVVVEGALVVY
jgi:hypothetical protein